jgi:hypothetical protein
MKWFRIVYPLRLREKLYFHFVSRRKVWPADLHDVPLEFAPAKISTLLHFYYGHRMPQLGIPRDAAEKFLSNVDYKLRALHEQEFAAVPN